MKIGIIGDTHDHLPNITRAVEALIRHEVDVVLHTGDYIAPFVIPILGSIPVRVVGVFGNNDGDRELLSTRSREQQNFEIAGYFADLRFDGERVALMHGHDRALLAGCVGSGLYDIVVSGHTHQPSVYQEGSMLGINPGEICGYLTGNPTYAIYDTGERVARIIPL
ncbi:MAG TPA: metallophosphoesterase [Methanolinea sp.]|nr:metallophosphoesterase [Methanolinea sp.]HQK55998.1 metallophosphoesterase [Methanolinea sp.]